MTNLRLPGQYDERLLACVGLQGPYYNWNRWYLPGVGRYLEPDPEGFKPNLNPAGDADEQAPQWYSYAGGNPLRFADPEGLFTKDPGCKNYPSEAAVLDYIKRHITDDGKDSCLKECMLRRLPLVHLACGGDDDPCKDYPNAGGVSELAFDCRHATDPIHWCSKNVDKSCRIKILVHELAHTCGWDHGQGHNVPGDDGTLTCRPGR